MKQIIINAMIITGIIFCLFIFTGAVRKIHDLVTIDASGRILVPAIYHTFGGFEGQGETVECGVGDWNHITNAGNNLWNLDEGDGVTMVNDSLVIAYGSDSGGIVSISLSSLNTKDFHVRCYNTTQSSVMGRPIGVSATGANNEVNVAVPLYTETTAGDTLIFQISSADGTDAVVDDGLFYLIYLHD